MLRIQDVTLTYPDGPSRLTALDAVTMAVDPGEFTAVTGPSGSGKSSLLAVGATLIRPDSGTVIIDGIDTMSLSPAQAARLRLSRLGIVFQAPNLIPSLTVANQLAIVARIAGTQINQKQIAELLEDVGIAQATNRYPHQLSGGQRQRVNIARALVGSPKVLLVDEPTSALDSDNGKKIIDLLRQVTTKHDVATVVVTHEREHLRFFDRGWEMVDGTLTEMTREMSEMAYA